MILVDKTWDPRITDLVEFTQRRISMNDGKPRCDIQLRLTSSTLSASATQALLSRLELSREDLYAQYVSDDSVLEVIVETLYSLRNIGLHDPGVMLEKLQALRSSWWNDGHLGETLSRVQAELETLDDGRTGLCPNIDE